MFLSKLGCRSKPHNLRYRELRGPHVESHVQREGPCGHSVLIGVVRSARIGGGDAPASPLFLSPSVPCNPRLLRMSPEFEH